MSILRKIRALLFGKKFERDMTEEMEAHLRMKAQAVAEEGAPDHEARARAQRDFGQIARIQEECRDQRDGLVGRQISMFVQDLRYGARTLARRPALTVAAVLTLGVGIGANATVFSCINALVFRPLQVAEAENVVEVWRTDPDRILSDRLTYPMFAALREQAASFSTVVASGGISSLEVGAEDTVADSGASIVAGTAQVELVSGNYFDGLQFPFALGRGFAPEEDAVPGRDPVVVISHRFWQRNLGADPNAVGRALRIGDHRYIVIGVAGADAPLMRLSKQFLAIRNPDAWAPLMMYRDVKKRETDLLRGGTELTNLWLRGYARLKPGVSIAQADAEMNAIVGGLSSERRSLPMRAEKAVLSRNAFEPPALVAIFAGPVVLLLVACANVGNMVLARTATRMRELAVRQSLGAGRSRLIRQLLTENLLLGLLGGGAGVVLSIWLSRSLIALAFGNDALFGIDLRTDGRVLAFSFFLGLAAPVLFGLVPALRISGQRLASALKAGVGAASPHPRLTSFSVATQMALSVVLVVAAGLSTRFAMRAEIRPDDLLHRIVLLNPGLTGRSYSEAETTRLFENMRNRLAQIPDTVVGRVTGFPWGGGRKIAFRMRNEDGGTERRVSFGATYAFPETFAALGMRLVAGRLLHDTDSGQTALVITDQAAQALWSGTNPIGRRLAAWNGARSFEIVGVVTRPYSAETFPEPTDVFEPAPANLSASTNDGLNLVVRHEDNPGQMLARVLREARATAADARPAAETGAQRAEQWASAIAKLSIVSSLIAAASLFVAAAGIYGVTSFVIGRRMPELGLRLALGTTGRSLVGLMLRSGLKPVLWGGLIGLAAALAGIQVLRSQVGEIRLADPMTLALVILILAGVSGITCWLAARRAAKVDPMTALRAE